MNKWTKGPWEVFLDGEVRGEDGVLVCVVDRRSDAGLIISAPDLYEALEGIKRDLMMRAEKGSDGCAVVDCSHGAWVRLNDALAKARGES